MCYRKYPVKIQKGSKLKQIIKQQWINSLTKNDSKNRQEWTGQGWGDGLVGKVPTVQALEPELESSAPTQ